MSRKQGNPNAADMHEHTDLACFIHVCKQESAEAGGLCRLDPGED